jgi:hypothetical protein
VVGLGILVRRTLMDWAGAGVDRGEDATLVSHSLVGSRKLGEVPWVEVSVLVRRILMGRSGSLQEDMGSSGCISTSCTSGLGG